MLGKYATALLLACYAALLAVCGSARADSPPVLELNSFIAAFPEHELLNESHSALIMRLDDSRVIAVATRYASSSSYTPPNEVAMLLVSAPTRPKAMRTAQRLADYFGIEGTQVVPFQGGEASVAVLFPLSMPTRISNHNPLYILLFPFSYLDKKNLRFIGWQGRKLKAVSDYRLPISRRSISIEFTIDITQASIEQFSFRPTKGNIPESDVADFVNERTWNSSSYLPILTTARKKELSREMNCTDFFVYSTSNDFAIVSRGKIYRAGTLDALRNTARSREGAEKFKLPKTAAVWPKENADTDNSDTTEQETNTPDIPQLDDSIDLDITPAEAMQHYLESLRSL